MTTGPLSMGLPEPLKIRPGGGQGLLENAQGQPWVSHCCSPSTPCQDPSHPPTLQMTHVPFPPSLSYLQRTSYNDYLFRGALSFFSWKSLQQDLGPEQLL